MCSEIEDLAERERAYILLSKNDSKCLNFYIDDLTGMIHTKSIVGQPPSNKLGRVMEKDYVKIPAYKKEKILKRFGTFNKAMGYLYDLIVLNNEFRSNKI